MSESRETGVNTRQPLPLWAGLWVPFAVVMFVLAHAGAMSVPAAIGIDLASAVVVSVAARASARRRAHLAERETPSISN
jgi:hypothetical protein